MLRPVKDKDEEVNPRKALSEKTWIKKKKSRKACKKSRRINRK